MLYGGFGMKGDAVVAAHSHRDAERDQFLGLAVERLRNGRCLCNVRKGFHDFGCRAAEAAELGAQFGGFLRPIAHRWVPDLLDIHNGQDGSPALRWIKALAARPLRSCALSL